MSELNTLLAAVHESQGRIEQKLDSHIESCDQHSARWDAAQTALTVKVDRNVTALGRVRGATATAGGLLTLIIGALGLDRFGG